LFQIEIAVDDTVELSILTCHYATKIDTRKVEELAAASGREGNKYFCGGQQ
jgi:hypothetical protein